MFDQQIAVGVLDENQSVDNEIVEELEVYKIIVGLDEGEDEDILELEFVDIRVDIEEQDILVVYRE